MKDPIELHQENIIASLSPEDKTYFKTLDQTAQQVFDKNGRLCRSKIASATAEFVRAAMFPLFQTRLANVPIGSPMKNADDPWWEGLNAISRVLSEDLSHAIGATLKLGEPITFEHFRRVMYARVRPAGPKGHGDPIPPQWANDLVWSTEWQTALKRAPEQSHRLNQMIALALCWDTFRIPLRYFTNSAAHGLLQEMLPSLFATTDYDVYLKNIRGTRKSSLLLSPNRANVIVKLKHHTSNVFRVNAAAAKRVGLTVNPLTITISPSGAVLHFELEQIGRKSRTNCSAMS